MSDVSLVLSATVHLAAAWAPAWVPWLAICHLIAWSGRRSA